MLRNIYIYVMFINKRDTITNMAESSQMELATAVIALVLFISSEILGCSKCDANSITDLLTRSTHAILTTTGTAAADGPDVATV